MRAFGICQNIINLCSIIDMFVIQFDRFIYVEHIFKHLLFGLHVIIYGLRLGLNIGHLLCVICLSRPPGTSIHQHSKPHTFSIVVSWLVYLVKEKESVHTCLYKLTRMSLREIKSFYGVQLIILYLSSPTTG